MALNIKLDSIQFLKSFAKDWFNTSRQYYVIIEIQKKFMELETQKGVTEKDIQLNPVGIHKEYKEEHGEERNSEEETFFN